MGCDGGSIPKRIELVKTKAKEERPDQAVQNVALWYFCALSKEPLKQPIVACHLGKLYNKEAILNFLLNKKAFGDGEKICAHITKTKDVIDLKLTSNPSFSETEKAVSSIMQNAQENQLVSQFICPITMKEMNGKNRFCFIASCGCALSDSALKQVPSPTCLNCNKPYTDDDVVLINATKPEDINRVYDRWERIKAVRQQEEAEKQSKKAAKKAAKFSASTTGGVIGNGGNDDGESDGKKRKHSSKSTSESVAKRQATDERSNINIQLPKLDDATLIPKHMRVHSEAIKSLYAKKGEDGGKVGNFLTRGTFTRYAGTF